MCCGSEAGSYLRLTHFVYHSTLGLRVIDKKKKEVLNGKAGQVFDADLSGRHHEGTSAAGAPLNISQVVSLSVKPPLISVKSSHPPPFGWGGGGNYYFLDGTMKEPLQQVPPQKIIAPPPK